MSKPPKIDRKALKNPDSFVSHGNQILDFLVRQRVRFLAVAVVGIAFVAGGYFMDWWSARKLDKGWLAYYEAMKAPEKERWDKLKAIPVDMGMNRPAFFAAVGLADHYFDEAKKDLLKDAAANSASAPLALEWYQKALTFKSLLPAEKQLLHINVGNAQELQKKYDEAATSYRSASEIDGEAKGLALLNLGRSLEMKNDPAKATETYEKISTDFTNSEYAKLAKNNLRRMKSPLLRNQKL